MRYAVMATVNYPDEEQDTPTVKVNGDDELLQWIRKLVYEPSSVSFVIVVSKLED